MDAHKHMVFQTTPASGPRILVLSNRQAVAVGNPPEHRVQIMPSVTRNHKLMTRRLERIDALVQVEMRLDKLIVPAARCCPTAATAAGAPGVPFRTGFRFTG